MNAELLHILPELTLAGGLCLLLLSGLLGRQRPFWEGGVLTLGILATTAALLVSRFQAAPTDAFGMLRVDRFAAVFQLAITAAAAVAVVLNLHQRRFAGERGRIEMQVLLLAATLGAFVVVGTQHLLMLYLGLEMLSLCSYALADVHKRDRAGAEAAMKYVVYGALSSGVMLFGISLWFGLAGASFAMPDLAVAVDRALLEGRAAQVLLPGLLVLAGFLFKLSLAPFHWWAPDVYQGTSTPVAAFLATGSKLAALGALLRVLATVFATPVGGLPEDPAFAELASATEAFRADLGWLLAGLAALSMLLGNLAALRQTHLRRLMAWSSVGHAGYLLAGIAVLGHEAFEAVALYGLVYGVASLAAFAAVLHLANRAGSDDLRAWRGLGWSEPLAAATLVVAFASLIGLPPTAGFAGKWRLLAALWEGGRLDLALLVALLSVVSLVYSFRVLRELYLERDRAGVEARPAVRAPWLAALLLIGLLATVALVDLDWLATPLQAAGADLRAG